MKTFGWAKNNAKLIRAIAIGADNEALVKDEYIKIGGLIDPTYPVVESTNEDHSEAVAPLEEISEPVVESEEAIDEVIESKPKKVTKKK